MVVSKSCRGSLARRFWLSFVAVLLPLGACVAQEPYDPQSMAGTTGNPPGGHGGALNVEPNEAGGPDVPGGSDSGSSPGMDCTSSARCAPPFPYCATEVGRCVECRSNSNCAGTLHRFCDPKSFSCVSCLTDQQCTSIAPYCASAEGACVQCLTSANCGDPGLACDRINFRCVPTCETNADCELAPETPVCDPMRSLCVACAVDGDCNGLTPHCDGTAGSCVACLADADCSLALPRCDTRTSACVQCVTVRDCSNGATCVGGTCVNPK